MLKKIFAYTLSFVLAFFMKSYFDNQSKQELVAFNKKCEAFNITSTRDKLLSYWETISPEVSDIKAAEDNSTGLYTESTVNSVTNSAISWLSYPFREISRKYRDQRRKELNNLEKYIELYNVYHDCGNLLSRDTHKLILDYVRIDKVKYFNSFDNLKGKLNSISYDIYSRVRAKTQTEIKIQELKNLLTYVNQNFAKSLKDLEPYQNIISNKQSIASIAILLTADKFFVEIKELYLDIYIHESLFLLYNLEEAEETLRKILQLKHQIETEGISSQS